MTFPGNDLAGPGMTSREQPPGMTRSTPEVVPGQCQGVFPLPSHLFTEIAVTHLNSLALWLKRMCIAFLVYSTKFLKLENPQISVSVLDSRSPRGGGQYYNSKASVDGPLLIVDWPST